MSQLRVIGNVRHRFRCSGTGTAQDAIYHQEYKETDRHIRAFLVFTEKREGRSVPTCLDDPYLVFRSGLPLPINQGQAVAPEYGSRGPSHPYERHEDDDADLTPPSDEDSGDTEEEGTPVQQGTESWDSSPSSSPSSKSTDTESSLTPSEGEDPTTNRRDSTDTDITKRFREAMHATGTFDPPLNTSQKERLKVSVSRRGKREVQRHTSSSPELSRHHHWKDEERERRRERRQDRKHRHKEKQRKGRRDDSDSSESPRRRSRTDRDSDRWGRQRSQRSKSRARSKYRARSKSQARSKSRPRSKSRQSRSSPADSRRAEEKKTGNGCRPKEYTKDSRPFLVQDVREKDADDRREAEKEYRQREQRREKERERADRRKYEEECRRREAAHHERHLLKNWTLDENAYAPIPDKEDLRELITRRKDQRDGKRPETASSAPAPTGRAKFGDAPHGGSPRRGSITTPTTSGVRPGHQVQSLLSTGRERRWGLRSSNPTIAEKS